MIYTYESPDHGQTIYRRIPGDIEKELYFSKGSPVTYPYGMWADILKAGTVNPELQELIERVIIYYRLSKTNGT